MPSNYPDGTSGSDAYFNEPDKVEVIDPEADAEDIRNLAVAQALFKVVKSEVATGNEFNLRGRVDAIMRERFNEAKKLGIAPKSFDIEIDGEKVGTYSITTSKPKPAETSIEMKVGSNGELFKWAVMLGYIKVDMDAVQEHFERTGEVPPGCELVPVTTSAVEGGKIERTSLRIDQKKVSHALGAELGDVAKDLLEGGV